MHYRGAHLLLGLLVAASASIFNVYDYGAKGDGVSLDTHSIQSAINDAIAAGGGVVLLPGSNRPTFLSAGLILGSHVIFRIEANATLLASPRFSDFKDVITVSITDEGGSTVEKRPAPLILFGSCAKPVYSPVPRCDAWNRLVNVTVDGGGVLDGSGEAWWDGKKYGMVAGIAPHILFPFYVTELRIADVTLTRSPFWHLHILACKSVTVTGITIDAGIAFNSTVYPTDNVDGIDINSCQDVLVENSDIKAGDDCVVVYHMHEAEMETRNILVRNTTCRTPFSVAGNGRNVSISNVTFENCTVQGNLTYNDHRFRPRWWQSALRIKANRFCNANIRDIIFRDIIVTDVDLAVDFTMYYACQNISSANYEDCVQGQLARQNGGIKPLVQRIRFERIRGTAWRRGWVRCLAESPCRDISFAGLDVRAKEQMICENIVPWPPECGSAARWNGTTSHQNYVLGNGG
jgi:polygalacturonase